LNLGVGSMNRAWCWVYLMFGFYIKFPSRLKKMFSGAWRSRGRPKVFVIGQNKTGTTSLEKAFKDLGFVVGDQRVAEILYDRHYFKNEFDPIIEYCKTAEVFQDVPFSRPKTYEYLDREFPDSKFILTVRDDSEQWYSSLTRFHAKLFGKSGRLPTVDDLNLATYVRRGFMYNVIRAHGTSDDDPYNYKIMTEYYESYNKEVLEYFKDRPDDLLVINVSEEGAYQKFVEFLGVDSHYRDFPWQNRT